MQQHDSRCFAFLDRMRASGVTSMYLAIPRLVRELRMSTPEARATFERWCAHYEATHGESPLFGRDPALYRGRTQRGVEAASGVLHAVGRVSGSAIHGIAALLSNRRGHAKA